MQTAGIIGGSGFIGSYITKIFLEENFKVKVSSTDINNKSKYEHLLTLTNSENLEMVPLDVRDKKALENFVKGCDILVHAGTPFQLDVKDPQKELFDPTVQGTRNFLEVISKSPDLKKVVIRCFCCGMEYFFSPESCNVSCRSYFYRKGYSLHERQRSSVCAGKIFGRPGSEKIY